MRPFKIPALLVGLCLCCLELIIPAGAKAQCTFATSHSITHDTVFTGTGNDYFNPLIPQFDPAIGDLSAIVIKSTVSLKYGFQIENTGSAAATPTIGVVRNDYLFGSIQKNYGPYSLAASNGVPNSGPDFVTQTPFQFLNHYTVVNDSISTGVAPFLGTGTMSYDYYPTTYSIVPSGLTYTFNANDTIHFSVTYYYCSATVLATGITDFTATLVGNTIAQLAWTTTNETSGGSYVIEKSADGIHFTDIGSLPTAPASGYSQYSYPYSVARQSGTLYFRLKVLGAKGNISYSEIRSVELGNGASSGLYLYPNPANDFVNVVFPQTGGNWQVDILSVSGALVQRNTYLNSNTVHIDFKKPLATGVYFMRATNELTRDTQMAPFVVK
jgi:hypothetical protein